MLAKEQSVAFENSSPLSVTVYRAGRQMPHYHREALEIIMCLKGTVEVYSMHEKHVLEAGDIKEADTYDIHTVSRDADAPDNLAASFHFDLTHPLFAGKGFELLYYVCSSDDIDNPRKPALHRLQRVLWALLYEELKEKPTGGNLRIRTLSAEVMRILRSSFQYFNAINLDDAYSRDMQDRFEHIIAYMLKNYAGRITMRDICEMEHLNYNYLSQFFKTTSLKTFRAFLHEIRVYHSEHMLLCMPEMSVPEIGYACGFSDPKFFYREFKKKHGHTPHQHRIWYRNYNKLISKDTLFTPEAQRQVICDCIAGFYSDMVCSEL
ncbi:MAG: AraC family transcriptional regulator [Lentihominibacter sp.]